MSEYRSEVAATASASSKPGLDNERATASATIEATPEAVFAVLTDPSAHAAIDGTGWVRQSLDGDRIIAAGQVFRMAMYHENHPDKDYEMANRVEAFDEPRTIAWKPGTESPETGELSFGGWIWRYDLEANGPSQTTVTMTYDWSAVPAPIREHIGFPPFGPDHLDNSLRHLSDLVTAPA
jgi:Polyketide cyclase / dehydrase and lipid transport